MKMAEKMGGGGVDHSGRVLMTIELELSRKNGEGGSPADGGLKKPKPLGFFSRIAEQLTFQ